MFCCDSFVGDDETKAVHLASSASGTPPVPAGKREVAGTQDSMYVDAASSGGGANERAASSGDFRVPPSSASPSLVFSLDSDKDGAYARLVVRVPMRPAPVRPRAQQ